MLPTLAAWLFAALVAFAVAFQLALAAGAPWGEYAMGGKHPGRFPAPMRVAAVIQAAVLVALAWIVLLRAGVLAAEPAGFTRWAAWIVVGISALSALMNLITPSRKERRLWGPVGVLLLVTSALVALS